LHSFETTRGGTHLSRSSALLRMYSLVCQAGRLLKATGGFPSYFLLLPRDEAGFQVVCIGGGYDPDISQFWLPIVRKTVASKRPGAVDFWHLFVSISRRVLIDAT
jgi:hypothetical protein